MSPTLTDLIRRWHEQKDRGNSLTPEDLCRDCPENLPTLRAHLEAVASMLSFLSLSDSGTSGADPALPPTRQWAGPAGAPSRQPAPVIPGYEILGELGRGGMGVVYQAWQRGLKRLVALKMLLTGPYAGPEQLARFRAEAEAVARLQHPSIVQIYEIGEVEGRPYFVLEYVEGGSLDRKLSGNPVPPKQAARQVQALADGVAAAHQAGVIHRDLKPANVLVGKGEALKVADFGLAKQVGAAPGQTKTGDVMGTPSYMAPEQAAGNPKDVGPACDIYALGAILYEMLTGRPPFKGASTWDTVQLVIATDPVPPARLNPQLPRDLETICLKCLHKDPHRRYPTAGELAEDLRRFLAGEPIRARPVGVAERAWRWARRNPAVAAVSAACVLILVGSLVGMTALYVNAEAHRAQAESDRHTADDERRTAQAERAQADAQRLVAVGEHRRADTERKAALAAEEEAKKQRREAETQRGVAREEADRARDVSRFLVGLFEASDPLGLNGFTLPLVNRTGEKLTAAELLDRGADRIAVYLKGQPRTHAAVLDTIGNVYRSQGEHARAEELLTKALDMRKAEKAPAGELAASLHSLAWLHHERGDYPEAVRQYREALRLRLGEADRDEAAVANTQHNLAWVLLEMEQYEEAEKLFKEVIERRVKRFGPDNRETALAKMALAALYLDAGRREQALPYANEAMATFDKLGEDRNVIEGAKLFQLGVFQFFLRNYDGAEKLLRQSLELVRKALGPRHLYATVPLVQLAYVLEARGKKDDRREAGALFREALDIAQERVGLGHPKVLILAQGVARLAEKREEGDAIFEKVMAALRERFGEKSAFVADAQVEYADFLRVRDPARAEATLKEAAEIYKADPGPTHRRAVTCQLELGHIQYRKRDYAASVPFYSAALTAARKRPWEKQRRVVALRNLVDPLLKLGKLTDEVDALLTEAEQLLPDLPASERELRHVLMQHRCFFLRLKGRHAEAAARVRAYLKGGNPSPVYLEHVAMEFALCIDVARKDQALSLEEQEQLAENYGTEAVAALRRVLQRDARYPHQWAKAPQLAPLRGRKDFQELLAGVKS
jgi:tetratricopeptide (TPR) repeat protein